MAFLKRLGIINEFKAIFTADLLNGMKPNPMVYHKISNLCGISFLEYNIYFFDNMAINLIYPKQLGWKTILIIPLGESIKMSCDEKVNDVLVPKAESMLDYKFDNINDAIMNFIELT
jgi:FMN phosphatase YigB (HAD superfamily)